MHDTPPRSRALPLGLCLAITLALPSCAAEPRAVSQRVMIARWDHDTPTASRFMPGLDLDAQIGTERTSRCDDVLDGRNDFLGDEGVDNQYAVNLLPQLEFLLSGSLSAAITEQLVRGEHLYGFEIEADDPSGPITVALVRFDADAPLTTSGGRLAGGAVVTSTRIGVAVASRDPGTLVAHFDALDIPMGDAIGTSNLRSVAVRLVIDDDGRVRHGDLAGAITLETVLAATDAVAAGSLDLALARTLVQPDLAPNTDGSICDLVSFGVGIDLVDVVVP